MNDIVDRVDPEQCPCVLAEQPVAPCTPENCFHFISKADYCSHCDVAGGEVRKLNAELRRVRADNRKLRELVRDVMPKLNRILADDE